MALAEHYEENLVALIQQLRLLFKAPNAKFVAATLGQTLQNDTTSTEGVILHAQLAVDGTCTSRYLLPRVSLPAFTSRLFCVGLTTLWIAPRVEHAARYTALADGLAHISLLRQPRLLCFVHAWAKL